MTTIVIIIAGAVVIAGAYLRWATRPVLVAYRVGRHVERMRTGSRASGLPPAAPAGAAGS